ncbi:hypothetical protein MRB53_015566 [Persea americana]|uniref:Uncharacterized protein n=1 Tax=Persea americana TaxID=3435 RepID=A0ACC2LZM0_PERAE|nr:hypothetical protein MRB53_015566 [Persea americana]
MRGFGSNSPCAGDLDPVRQPEKAAAAALIFSSANDGYNKPPNQTWAQTFCKSDLYNKKFGFPSASTKTIFLWFVFCTNDGKIPTLCGPLLLLR